MSYFTKRCRASGTSITVCRAEDEGFDPEDGKWVTICNTHATICHHDTKVLADRASTFPDFCDECRAILYPNEDPVDA